MRSIRPTPELDALAGAVPHGPHQPLVLGTAARAFGLEAHAAGLAVLHEAATGPATAAVGVLGFDPFGVRAVLTGPAPLLDTLAIEAAAHAGTAPGELPSPSAPMLDISAESHAEREVRLFAS
jgi:urease accessory protein